MVLMTQNIWQLIGSMTSVYFKITLNVISHTTSGFGVQFQQCKMDLVLESTMDIGEHRKLKL